jgi:uncharacterized protein (DUF433 family)
MIEMEYSFEGSCFMKLEEYFNALAPDDIRLKGTRIGIESILYEYIYRSKTPEEIAEQFHTVTLEQVYATILYYLHHRSEVDAYLVDWLEFSRIIREEQQRNPSPARMRFRQMQSENAPKQLQKS